jgi:glucose/arabinose dehydrogenase
VPKAPFSRLVLSPILIVVGLVSACGDDGGGAIQEPGPVTQVSVTAPGAKIDAGETVQLTARARDGNNTVVEGKTFEWSSSDEAIATVSSAGLVRGVNDGQAQISATTEGVSGSITITVAAVPAPPPGGPVTVGLQEIVTGLDFPVYLTSPPSDERLFVLEKEGTIRIVSAGTLQATPFLDIRGKVGSQGGEQGLLGLAFSLDYATSGRFFVHYTDNSGASRISEFRVPSDPNIADPASELDVLTVTRPGTAHNGGQLLFGPDGFLYIGLGDGDDSDNGRGQSVTDLLASILRIDVSAGNVYTVPPDNPFVGTAGARPEVWSYGLRNPWRFNFDRATGDLYIGDVGEGTWEEVNFASAATGAGKGVNYGWSVMEGQHCTRSQCDQTGLTLPVLEYAHTEGCSITGGYVYRGSAIPSLQGSYFYSDYCAGWIRSVRMEGGVATAHTDWPALEPGGQVTSFGEDAAGELYLTTEQGGVYKVVPE